jgi:hypothetical protein
VGSEARDRFAMASSADKSWMTDFISNAFRCPPSSTKRFRIHSSGLKKVASSTPFHCCLDDGNEGMKFQDLGEAAAVFESPIT